ncbi:MAG TPA: CBM35 domain-containing protein [Vicinamibacteria bacterium]
MEGSPKPGALDQAAEPYPAADANGRGESPTPAERRAALEEVLQSGSFLRAEQKRSFLRYICEMELAGRGAELSEYLIGVEALGRPPGYSTGEDSSVRRHAHDLRQRLEEVYATELAGARVRIELPKGRYAPRFLYWDGLAAPAAPALEGEAEAGPAAAAAEPRAPGERRRAFLLGIAVGMVATAAAAAVAWRLASREPPPTTSLRSLEVEAHTNTVTGGAARGDCRNCSAGGRVRWVGKGNEVTVNGITVSESGNYTLEIDYVLDGERSLSLSVNGGPPQTITMRGKTWVVPASARLNVALHAGRNSIRFFNEEAYGPDLDRIVVR